MKSFKLILFLLSVNTFALIRTTHAVLSLEKTKATDNKNEGTKTVIELNNGITVTTGLDLNKTLAELNVTEASNVPKSRRRNQNNGTIVIDSKIVTTTIAAPVMVTKVLTEAGVLDIKGAAKNTTEEMKTKAAVESAKNFVNVTSGANKEDKNTANTVTPSMNKTSSSNGSTITKPLILANSTSNATNRANSSAISKTSSPTAGTTMSSYTTTTTTTTTTPKPKKPTITYSVPDYPDLEKDNPELKHLLQTSVSNNKSPLPEGPYAQPSQEFNGSFHRGRDFILPIVSMIFIIPLVIGIIITSYRRFRDCWSTRHYRRMDFLVDGMYND